MAGEAFGLRAAAKAELARLGQTLKPDATMQLLEPPSGGRVNAVIVDRVVKDAQPDYCIHGYVDCIRCQQLCWLGSETNKIVSSGRAYPMCVDCAQASLPSSHPVAEHVRDHRRADGPHDD